MERNFSAFTITLDYRADHGILGQKWGVRRYQNEDGTLTAAGRKRYDSVAETRSKKTGESIYLNRRTNKYADDPEETYELVVGDKKVGDLFLENKGSGELNINYIDVKKQHQGRGYAQAVMNQVIDRAKKDGFKRVTLEVPEGDDDARHIYEKNGFVAKETDEFGLTKMELRFDNTVQKKNSDYRRSV